MRFRRLRSKIIFSFCLLMLVGGGVTTLLVQRHLRESLLATSAERAEIVAGLLAKQLAGPVGQRDWERAQLIVDTESDHNAFVVLETPDRVLTGLDRNGSRPGAPDGVVGQRRSVVVQHEGNATVSYPARLASGSPGTVHVGVSLADAEATTEFVVREVVGTTLAAMLVGVIGIFFLSGLITRPITGLAEAAQRMGAGALDTRAPVEGNDELAELASSFNEMAQQLRDRMAASEDLRRYYERILDHLTKGVIVLDLPGRRIEYANGAAKRLYQAEAGAPIASVFGEGRPLGSLPVLPDDGDQPKWQGTHTMDDGRALALSAARLGNHHEAVVVSIADVTELAQLGERLRRTERIAAAGELAAGIVHAINNPLDGVHRALDLAQRHAEDPKRMETLLALALEGTDRIAQVTRSLLTFARADEIGSQLELAPDALIRGAVELVSLRAEGSDIRLTVRVAPGLPRVRVEPRAMTDVLVNLLSNALDVAPGGSEVEVEALPGKAGGVELRVEDRGPGVPEPLRQRIFEPFFTTKDARHGTGLGLSMARRIVEASGGSLEVRGREGGGALFAVCLPASAPLAVERSPA